jgi:type II secretory pathway pseudopilin PulG
LSRSAITERGFTLTELAVVFTIVALLLGSLLYTLAAQSEQRSRDTTLRRLDEAKELLLTFAIVNGRLPCPASTTSNGDESPAGGGICTDFYTGYLPAKLLGFQPTDSSGYALDPWGNRIRYAVSQFTNPVGTAPHFVNATNLKNNGVATASNDLLICASATGITTGQPPTCGAATNSVTNAGVIAAVVWSQGKNYISTVVGGADETANNKHRLPAVQNNHAAFVWHPPAPTGATGGEYDDLMTWIPVGVLYGRMVSAGVLP